MFAVNLQEVINEIQKIVPGDDNVKLDMSQVADLIMTMKFSLQVQGKICTGAYNDLCICPFC